jgi:hypothetical protein
MEIYTLDGLLRRTRVVDKFKSLIWTERFQSAGDFELQLPSTTGNRAIFTPDTWLALNESFRCMKVETVSDETDDDGTELLVVKGPSIELPTLDDRVAFNVKDDLTTNPKWVITDQPADVARKVFNDICVLGVLDTDDILPYITAVSILPDDSIPEPTDTITVEITPDTVYNVIKQLCEAYDMGFRLLRNYDLSQLAFDIYTGSDRTTNQTVLPAVIFSPDFQNLKSTTRLETTAGVKNVAYVYSNLGFEEVVATDVDPSVAGFERHILVVKMDDFDAGTPAATVTAAMQQKGREELAFARRFIGFDGEVTQRTQYKYGIDYQLGDLVEMRGKDGISAVVRVTEQIFSSDAEGDKSYPTLSNKLTAEPGSWASMGNAEWIDYDDDLTTYWSSMP